MADKIIKNTCIVFLTLIATVSCCQQYSGKRYYDKTIKTIKRELFRNDTTWHADRYEGVLTRNICINRASQEKMDNLVSEFKRHYIMIYYGTRDSVCDAYNYPERCSYDQLLRLPREFLGYATDFYQVAIFEDENSLILIGYTTNWIVIFEPYLY